MPFHGRLLSLRRVIVLAVILSVLVVPELALA
jgi:hypothetical protein